uniref:Uncharacterized protein n=1 Tax=viral metagenome TaxID=1070528 RepID=A0A6C0K8W1_9ZZZZ
MAAIIPPPDHYAHMYLVSLRSGDQHCFLFKEPYQKEARKIIWDLKKNVDFALKGYAHSYFIVSSRPGLSRVLTHTTCRLILSRDFSARVIQVYFRRIRGSVALRNMSVVSKSCHCFYSCAPLDVMGEIKSFF